MYIQCLDKGFLGLFEEKKKKSFNEERKSNVRTVFKVIWLQKKNKIKLMVFYVKFAIQTIEMCGPNHPSID